MGETDVEIKKPPRWKAVPACWNSMCRDHMPMQAPSGLGSGIIINGSMFFGLVTIVLLYFIGVSITTGIPA
jgi:hypothetical protein